MKLAVFWALAWRLAVFLSVPVLTLRQFKRFFVLSGLDVFIDQFAAKPVL